MKLKTVVKRHFVLILIGILAFSELSGNSNRADTISRKYNFSGSVSVTNKGISLIPNLTLGKPAVIFDLSAGNRLTFDPQLRFALDGKPWSFLFWWRYKAVQGKNFSLNLGTHPALAFKTLTVQQNGTDQEIIGVSRYLASEITPTFKLSKNISAGGYYLYSHGFDHNAVKNTHYVSFRIYFSKISLTDKISARFSPQFYYLNLTGSEGYYLSSSLSISHSGLPFSISSLASKAVETNIAGNTDLLWNISFSYNFGKELFEK